MGEDVVVAKTLTIFLAADTKKLSQGLNSANKELTGFGGTLKNMLGPALIGATAAAGALAVKLGVDGVQAAIEDQKAAESLAQTLENLGLAHDTAPVEGFIDALQRQTGVADDQLRPAFDRLVRSIGDTAQAQDALKLALDVSAGSGKSLDAVAQALGRAYDGNTAALSRLGAGIDASVLKTGDMEAITAQLSATFSGQAAVAANTYEGRIRRLGIAADELKEAFGAGLLSNIDSVFRLLNRSADATGDTEDAVSKLGEEVGLLISGLAVAADRLTAFGGDTVETTADITDFGDGVRYVLQNLNPFTTGGRFATDMIMDMGREAEITADALNTVTLRMMGLAQYFGQTVEVTERANAETSRYTELAKSLGAEIGFGNRGLQRYNAYLQDLEGNSGSAGAASEKLTDRLQRQTETVDGLRSALASQVSELERGAAAVNSYVESVAGKILGGLDLGEAYAQQFDEEGNRVGKTLIEAFQAQVNQAEWFGNVLEAIRASGGSERLINAIAAEGPEAGGALGQQIIDQGLIPELDAKLTTAAEAANRVGVAMAATFAPNGVSASIQMVNGIAEQLQKEGKRLGRIGEEMGKPIGARLKAQIAEDVAAAVRAAEAAGAAARAEAVAREEARQAAITEQAIAQAVQRLIVNSDQRAGRNTQPVLA
jgi:hypothetical protein